jgi:hypothetical protein
MAPSWSAGTPLPLDAHADVETRGWEEYALDDPAAFEAEMEEIGLAPEDVAAGLDAARAGRAEVDEAVAGFWRGQDRRYIDAPETLLLQADLERRSALSRAADRLRDWFAGYRQTVEARELTTVEVPLFVLAAATPLGCTARYESTREVERDIEWKVDVVGTGMAGHAVATSTVTSGFEAKAGEAVLVHLPLTVAVERVRTSRADGTPVSIRTRINPSSTGSAPGARLLDLVPACDQPIETYDLSGYPPANRADYTRTYAQARSTAATLGVKALGVSLTTTGTVTLSTALTLKYELSGGHTYTLHTADTVDGLLWTHT